MRTGVQSKDDFINFVAAVASADAVNAGLHVVSPIIAQAIIESRWGLSDLATKGNNLFGIKCGSAWKGASINMTTKEEYVAGAPLTTISALFRKYDSWEESIHDYFKFISTKRYKNLFNCLTPLDYCNEIKNAGYATSSSYVNTLMDCINQYALTDFDKTLYTTDNGDGTFTEEPTPEIVPDNKITAVIDYSKVVDDVIKGVYGSGDARINLLAKNGYNPLAVQYMVNLQVKINALTETNEIIYNVINKVKEVVDNEIR